MDMNPTLLLISRIALLTLLLPMLMLALVAREVIVLSDRWRYRRLRTLS
jgi:hypothetical protein